MISIILPTIRGRERHYTRAYRAYEERTSSPFEIVTIRNFPACGPAWNTGARLAQGEHLHFTADDLEPHEGWDLAALEALADGFLPAPVIYRLDGSVESSGGHWDRMPRDREITLNTCVVPFFPRLDWGHIGPIIETHYYTDNYFSDRARASGCEFAIRTGYAFTHHWAQEGRGDEQARLAADRAVYQETRRLGA